MPKYEETEEPVWESSFELDPSTGLPKLPENMYFEVSRTGVAIRTQGESEYFTVKFSDAGSADDWVEKQEKFPFGFRNASIVIATGTGTKGKIFKRTIPVDIYSS
jgi:hypothetical protein